MRNLRDASKPAAQAGIPGVFNIFRKNAGSLDQLTSHLRSLGFPVETPADTLDLLQQRLTQRKPIHGSYAREEAQDGMQHAGAYYRRQEKVAPTTPADLKAQAEGWRGFLQKVAPKTALRLEVKIGSGAHPSAGTHATLPSAAGQKESRRLKDASSQ